MHIVEIPWVSYLCWFSMKQNVWWVKQKRERADCKIHKLITIKYLKLITLMIYLIKWKRRKSTKETLFWDFWFLSYYDKRDVSNQWPNPATFHSFNVQGVQKYFSQRTPAQKNPTSEGNGKIPSTQSCQTYRVHFTNIPEVNVNKSSKSRTHPKSIAMFQLLSFWGNVQEIIQFLITLF